METSKKAHKKVGKVMHEFKMGTLTSHGEKVTDHSQAVAIALSEARKIDPNYQMRKQRRKTGGFGDKAKALWGKTKEHVSKAHKAITPHVKSAFEKSKEVAGKGYEKVEAGVKSGYRKSRRYTEQKIHDQKKKIALQVIDDTIDKVSGNTHKNTLAGAEELVEDKYGKGSRVKERTALTPEERQFVREESQDSGQGFTYRAKILFGEYIVLKEKDGRPVKKWTVDNYEIGKKISDMLNKANEKEAGRSMATGGIVIGGKTYYKGLDLPQKGDSMIVEQLDGSYDLQTAHKDFTNKDLYVEQTRMIWKAEINPKKSSGGSMAKGGFIPNNYKGHTVKQIWDEWNESQREHFIADHKDEIIKDADEVEIKEYEKHPLKAEEIGKIKWNQLPEFVKRGIEKHIHMGQYSSGGKAGVISKVGEIPSGVNIRFNRYDEPFVVNYSEGEGVTEWLAKFKQEYPNVEQYPSRQTGGGADEASPSVATLIAFADTNEKLSEEKAQIYTMAEQMKWDTERLHQQFKRIFSYMTETAYNKEHPEAPIELTEDERNEFADMVSNPMITPIVSSEGEPNISGAKANLEEANRKLDEAENHADTTEDKIEEAKTNVEHAQDDLQGNPLPFKDAGKIKNSSMTKEKEKLAEKISKLEVALAGNKLSAKARASMEKKLEKYKADFNRRIPVYERMTQGKGKFFIEIPVEYRTKMNILLSGTNLKPRYNALEDKLRITVDNKPKLNRLYKIYSDMLTKKSIAVPSLEEISGKPAKVRKQA